MIRTPNISPDIKDRDSTRITLHPGYRRKATQDILDAPDISHTGIITGSLRSFQVRHPGGSDLKIFLDAPAISPDNVLTGNHRTLIVRFTGGVHKITHEVTLLFPKVFCMTIENVMKYFIGISSDDHQNAGPIIPLFPLPDRTH